MSYPLSLTIANSGRQTGSFFSDSGGFIRATFPALTSGVVSVNNTSWGDFVFWDISALVGADVLVSGSPNLSLDWLTDTGPGEASVLGYGFCVASTIAGASVGTNSRWTNLYSDGAGEEGINAKRNLDTGQVSSLRAGPGVSRLIPTILNNRFVYLLSCLNHSDTGNNPVTSTQTPWNSLTGSEKLYAFLSGGPASAAVGEVTWDGALQLNYGGGR